MAELQGITWIDSLYERIGLETAGRLSALLRGIGLAWFLVLSSLAYLAFRGAQHGSFRPLVVYLFVAAFVWFLLSPVRVLVPALSAPETIEAPRLLVFLDFALDRLVAAGTDGLRGLREDLDRDRAAFMLRGLDISDGALRARVRGFLRDCTEPELVAREAEGRDVSDFFLMPLLVADFAHLGGERDQACRRVREEVRAQVTAHLEARPDVAMLLRGGSAPEWLAWLRNLLGVPLEYGGPSYYLVNIAVARTWFEKMSELQSVRSAAGESSWRLATSGEHATFPGEVPAAAGEFLVHAWTRLSRELDVRGRRYEVLLQAPAFYGLCQMLVLAGFPLAMLGSLLPGGWAVLVAFGRILLSIKLWPLFWNLLALLNSVTDEPDARLVLPAVYVAIPVISYVLVNLTAGAASAFRFSVAPGPSPAQAAGLLA